MSVVTFAPFSDIDFYIVSDSALSMFSTFARIHFFFWTLKPNFPIFFPRLK